MQVKFWFLSALVLGACVIIAAQPLRAQCKVIWILSMPCINVELALSSQIEAWAMTDCTMDSEKCQYELISANQTQIIARHTSAVCKYVDNIRFFLRSDAENLNCRLVGLSISDDVTRVYDNGTNYCNLYNLVEGSGLTNLPEYHEISNDRMCTQRSTANCTIY
ncbi:hypothetical protein ANANG_G00171440 [Anguilla anguilla]|uniref:Uncharacterized protein n=1 Tax=Anguilla anguilla TaxID=7936 RepID=A0A9D3M6U8_ANGAN|nr:hypothetical protein ANANG_G00171440 [Anguilla anguilla]